VAYILFLVSVMSFAAPHEEPTMNALASESTVIGVAGTTCDGVIPGVSGAGVSLLVIKQQYVSVSSPDDSVTTRIGYLYETPGGKYRFQPFKNHAIFATNTYE